jgi:hypothetical protein
MLNFIIGAETGVPSFQMGIKSNAAGSSEGRSGGLVPGSQEVADEVELIVRSSTFRSSPALRQLLCFLAEKSRAGETDQLKEHSVGIDGLGKPDSFDNRRDSSVRLQMRRLRQKLAEYYSTEGYEDPYLISVPKGGFKIECTERTSGDSPVGPARSQEKVPASSARHSRVLWILTTLTWVLVALAFALGAFTLIEVWREMHLTSKIHGFAPPRPSAISRVIQSRSAGDYASTLRSNDAYFASSTGTSLGLPSMYILAESKKPATFRWNLTSFAPLFCQNQPWMPVDGAVKVP